MGCLGNLVVLLTAFTRVSCVVELEYDSRVETRTNGEAFLKCKVVSQLTIKQVQWFKIKNQDLDSVYYYEPATDIDRASFGYERASRSQTDNTSLIIDPVYLSDNGLYRCRITVWESNELDFIPVEKSANIMLLVNVAPNGVQFSSITNGENMTLTCTATGSKPAANITWIKTAPDGTEIVIQNGTKTMNVDNGDGLSDTIGKLNYSISKYDRTATISCLINHTETETIIYKSVKLFSPVIQNAVYKYIERLGLAVPYSTYEDQYDDVDNPAGLVKITADPGFQVLTNSPLILRASAPDVFPEPTFMWWTGKQVAFSGPELYIPRLTNDTTYYVLAQNPVGKVLLSVTVNTTDPGEINTVTQGNDEFDVTAEPSTAGMNGGLIAAIVIGSMLFLLFILLTIWYLTCKNPPNEGIPQGKKKSKIVKQPEEENPFVPSEKPLMRTTSTQTLEGKRPGKRESMPTGATSEDNLLSSSSRHSRRIGTPPPKYASKERTAPKHVGEYEESASFVGEYGSRNGLESASDDNLHSAHEDGDTQSEKSLPASDNSGRPDIRMEHSAV